MNNSNWSIKFARFIFCSINFEREVAVHLTVEQYHEDFDILPKEPPNQTSRCHIQCSTLLAQTVANGMRAEQEASSLDVAHLTHAAMLDVLLGTCEPPVSMAPSSMLLRTSNVRVQLQIGIRVISQYVFWNGRNKQNVDLRIGSNLFRMLCIEPMCNYDWMSSR